VTEGLSNGDLIDEYLADHLQSGNEVRVPAGEYEWRGDRIGGSYNNAALVGDGDVTFNFSGEYWNTSIFAVDGGDFAIQNVTIRGAIESGTTRAGSDSTPVTRRRPSRSTTSTSPMATSTGPRDRDLRRPGTRGDGSRQQLPRRRVPEQRPVRGCVRKIQWRRWGVLVENSFFKNNNIDAVRLGGDGDTIRNCVIVQETVPAYHNGAKSGRGLRIRYPGDDITVENVHITCNTSSPFLVPDRAEGPSGEVNNLYIENNTGTTAAYVESGGSFTGDTIHVTGSGNTNVTGFDSASNVVSGSDAESPATSCPNSTVVPTRRRSTATLRTRRETRVGEDDTSSLEHTITVDGSTSTEKQYYFEVSGEVRADSGINPDDTINQGSVDGTMYGGATATSSPASHRLRERRPRRHDCLRRREPDRPERVQQLPNNEITIEGSGDYEKTYSFAVSGEIKPGSSINPDDSVSESSVDGVVWFSADRYEFSGDITELEVDSQDEVTVKINGPR